MDFKNDMVWAMRILSEGNVNRLMQLTRLSKPPILIGGCGRSGTSLLQSILSAHPSIICPSIETNIFIQPRKFRSMTFNRLNNLRKLYAYLLIENTEKRFATRWCEKTPRNIRFFDKTYNEFGGDIRLINIVRDGRAVVTSIFPETGKYHIDPIRWVKDVQLGTILESKIKLLTIRYEDLILDFEKVIKTICDYIDEPMVPEILDYYNYSSIKDHGAWHGGKLKPIFTSSLDKWKSPKHNKRVESLLSTPGATELLKYYSYL